MKELFLSLTLTQQGGIIVLFLLIPASAILYILKKIRPDTDWAELGNRIKAWWIMAVVFLTAMSVNRNISIVFFALLSFLALKEYFSIFKTRLVDQRAIFWAFLTIPIQYYWIVTQWYGMFLIFIPVYMFLFLPVRLVLVGEMQGFLAAASRIQWGIMAFVFGLGHIAYLLTLPQLSGIKVSGTSLVFFLVLMTELGDVSQYIWGKILGKHKILPLVSPKKTWEGFLGGVFSAMILGAVFRFLTPFSVASAIVIGAIIAIVGFCGDVVMSAVKRDAGVKDFGQLIPGHGGMLDRVDSLCFTAPVFFHIVVFFYYSHLS
ncbi:MAG: phosphatidate cytidylyltransferase [Candidatus Omnitrophica bacterium]|nr:phosphatidate cytidylyltransferase [Candidatus Omnitrophota bacterium]